jgi:hypothetical protein
MAEHRYGGPWTQVKLERLNNIRGRVWKDSIEFQKLDIASLELSIDSPRLAPMSPLGTSV